MSIIDELVYDRTMEDVSRWLKLRDRGYADMTDEEKAEWDAGMKGAYNAADLNRVEEAVRYLAGRLNGFGYLVQVETKTDWTFDDIPTTQDLERYIRNVRIIRGALEMLKTTPPVPDSIERLTWSEANDIEKIMADMDLVIDRVVKSFPRLASHTFISGNRPIPSAESDQGRTWAELDLMNTTWSNWQVADWYLLLYGNLKAEGDVV